MNALIIEDEELTAERLADLINDHTQLKVVDILYSVKSATDWLKNNPAPDLIFLDIQLGDGSGFDILDQLDIFPKIIFTTAFDQYAIEAFKYNSIDYLLKPVKLDELTNAIQKAEKIGHQQDIPGLIASLQPHLGKKYKQKFLVKVGLKYRSFHIGEIAYFYSEEGETYLKTKEGETCIVDHTLDAITEMINPEDFFRINRHFIIHAEHITSIDSFFNNRLSLEVHPKFKESIIVSRERVKSFKQWLDE